VATLSPPRESWSEYASGSGVDHFRWWCENYCIQSIDQFAGKPLVLEQWQVDFFGEVMAVDDDEMPYWSTVALIVPRKQGKTTLLGAYGMYHLDQSDGMPEVLLTASSDKQAGRLFDAVTSFTRRSPFLTSRVHIRDHIGEIARADGLGKILRMSSDPSRAHGYNPSRYIADELHAWTTPSLRKFWEAVTTAGGARRDTQGLVITTAGEAHTRAHGILGNLIDRNESAGEVEQRSALTISRNHDARVLVYNYSAPVEGKDQPTDRRNFAAIRAANPASWVTDEYLERQIASPELSDSAFLQLHGCVWAAGTGTYIAPSDWQRLGDGGPIDSSAPLYVMIDGSFTYDTTAVSWASPHEDGRIDIGLHVFSARHDAPHHTLCPGGEIDFAAVEQFTISLGARVREVAFDPRFMARSSQIIAAGLPHAAVFAIEPQSAHMHDAVSAMRKGAIEGVPRHQGDAVAAAHVGACVVKDTSRGPVLDKRLASRPIDGAVAMTGAYWRASLAHIAPVAFLS